MILSSNVDERISSTCYEAGGKCARLAVHGGKKRMTKADLIDAITAKLSGSKAAAGWAHRQLAGHAHQGRNGEAARLRAV